MSSSACYADNLKTQTNRINSMRKLFLYIILAIASSSCFAWGEEKICGIAQINNNTCKKGDVLMVGGNTGIAVAFFCDLSNPVAVVNNQGGFVCYYIGYQRQMRE